MINKELFEGPVGDYCIARNTIKCLFFLVFDMCMAVYRCSHTIVYELRMQMVESVCKFQKKTSYTHKLHNF